MFDFKNWEDFLHKLKSYNVSDIVFCSGGRNLQVYEKFKTHFEFHHFFDERSAGFYALGLIKKTQKAVAVCTTSGTAVAEVYPAVIEAYYEKLPLIVISADRPVAHEHTGSPQCMVQKAVYGRYSETQEWGEDLCFPAHINLNLDEYVSDEAMKMDSKIKTVTEYGFRVNQDYSYDSPRKLEHKKNYFMFGPESSGILKDLNLDSVDYYSESLSQISPQKSLILTEVESQFDRVIRVGRVPTCRLWRDLEKSSLEVISFSDVALPGLPQREVFPLEIEGQINSELQSLLTLTKNNPDNNLVKAELSQFYKLKESYNQAEYSLIDELKILIQKSSDPSVKIFLGNSLPIRIWDETPNFIEATYFGNRGLNGIDGLISTALGLSDEKTMTWVVVGDLSAIYDLNSPFIHLDQIKNLKIVIVNNKGGQIFRKISSHNQIRNEHTLDFKSWCEFFKMDYQKLENSYKEVKLKPGLQVIELKVDPEQTQAWEKK